MNIKSSILWSFTNQSSIVQGIPGLQAAQGGGGPQQQNVMMVS